MPPDLVIHGFPESVYLRAVLMTCEEKGLGYRTGWDLDFEGPEHLALHPFGKVPILQQGDFRLFETNAICRYLDEAFDGPALQPADVRDRAKMNQWISVIDAYVYPRVVTQLVGPRRAWLDQDQFVDPALFLETLPLIDRVCDALDDRLGRSLWLSGAELGLADLLLALRLVNAFTVLR